jgi:hypothetical protein
MPESNRLQQPDAHYLKKLLPEPEGSGSSCNQ